MIVVADVHYDEQAGIAHAAALTFESWTDDTPVSKHRTQSPITAPYISGEFWRRELEPLRTVLKTIKPPIKTIIIDGYADLGHNQGLGTFLYEDFGRTVPIIGIAKREYHGVAAHKVCRTGSKEPLFVTTLGIHPSLAITFIQAMHGDHRLPTLVVSVDRLARKG